MVVSLADVGPRPDPDLRSIAECRTPDDLAGVVLPSDAPEGPATPNHRPSRRETPGGQVYRVVKDNHSIAIPGVSGSQDHTTGPSVPPTT